MIRGECCLACFIDDLAGAMALLDIDEKARCRILVEGLNGVAEDFPKRLPPSYTITRLHRILKRETGIAVPFKELREACNRVGGAVAKRVEGELRERPDAERFHELVLWAIAGNHLDFRTVGTGYGFEEDEIYGMLDEKRARGLDRDDTDAIRALVLEAKRILFIPDNVGELAFDLLLLDEIRSISKARVTLPLRGGPITSDATMEDGEALGVADHVDELIVAGPDTLGISWDEKSSELARAFDEADLVITKGQANFYVVSEHANNIPGRVVCLLTTKCDLASSQFGLSGKVNVAALLDGEGKGS